MTILSLNFITDTLIGYLNSMSGILFSCARDSKDQSSNAGHLAYIGYNSNPFRQTACLGVNSITVDNFAYTGRLDIRLYDHIYR